MDKILGILLAIAAFISIALFSFIIVKMARRMNGYEDEYENEYKEDNNADD